MNKAIYLLISLLSFQSIIFAMEKEECISYEEQENDEIIALSINETSNCCLIHYPNKAVLYNIMTRTRIGDLAYKECKNFQVADQSHITPKNIDQILTQYAIVKKYMFWDEDVRILHKYNDTIIMGSYRPQTSKAYIRFIKDLLPLPDC